MPKKKKWNLSLVVGGGIVLFFVLVALLAPLLAPCDPHAMGIPYLRPSGEHLLGTNDVGQDIFSELIYGTRVSMLIGFFTAISRRVASLNTTKAGTFCLPASRLRWA